MKHSHPPDRYHVYKLFILCRDSGQTPQPGMETTEVGWFSRSDIPPLSLLRITREQVEYMFQYYDDPQKAVMCD